MRKKDKVGFVSVENFLRAPTMHGDSLIVMAASAPMNSKSLETIMVRDDLILNVLLQYRCELRCIERRRHRAVSLRQNGFLVLKALRQSCLQSVQWRNYLRCVQISSTKPESSASSSSSSSLSCRARSSSQTADTEHHRRTSMTSLMTSLTMASAGVHRRLGLVMTLLKVQFSAACFRS